MNIKNDKSLIFFKFLVLIFNKILIFKVQQSKEKKIMKICMNYKGKISILTSIQLQKKIFDICDR